MTARALRGVACALLVLLPAMPVTAEPDASQAVAEVGLVGAVRGWKTAYRKSSAVFAYGVTGGWIPRPWIELRADLDHARRSSTPDDLRITSTETWLTLGPRLGFWVDFLRIFGEGGLAGTLRTVRYRDEDHLRDSRLGVGGSIGAGITIAVAERLGVTVRTSWRRRDDQSHLIASLDVTWLFSDAIDPAN